PRAGAPRSTVVRAVRCTGRPTARPNYAISLACRLLPTRRMEQQAKDDSWTSAVSEPWSGEGQMNISKDVALDAGSVIGSVTRAVKEHTVDAWLDVAST